MNPSQNSPIVVKEIAFQWNMIQAERKDPVLNRFVSKCDRL
jgi:hypothetical protein